MFSTEASTSQQANGESETNFDYSDEGGSPSPEAQLDGERLCAGGRGSAASTPSDSSAIDLSRELDTAARYSLARLVGSVLYSDFAPSPDIKEFRTAALNLVIDRLKLSEKVARSIRNHYDSEQRIQDDVLSLIVTVKGDKFIAERGGCVVLADLVAMFVGTGCYDSRARVLLRHLATFLAVSWESVEDAEGSIAHLLLEQTYAESEESVALREKNQRMKKMKRYVMIGATASLGGALIGLTGGLAAPLVAAGAGVVIGTGAAAGIATTAGAAVLGSIFGVAGAGLSGYKMQKRVGAIEEFSIESLSSGQSLHCAIAVSGWIEIEREDSFEYPWRHLNVSKEQYCLRYESKYLLELGKAMEYFMSFAVSVAIQQTLMETALAGLLAAVTWPVALLSAASVLDNPWSVCTRRAREVGQHLAELLLSRQQGMRPITLLGFSLGARVIFHCLLELSRRPKSHGIVEDVVLLGAPVAASRGEWRAICSVVGGRLVNGYCKSDWMLRFLYRAMNAQAFIAGTAPVDGTGMRNLVNLDLTHIVRHLRLIEKNI